MEDTAISYGEQASVDTIYLNLKPFLVFAEDHFLYAVNVSEYMGEGVLKLNEFLSRLV